MKKKYAKVEGYPNLLRDLDTNAIINIDSKSASTYDRTVQRRKSQSEEIKMIKSDISDLKNTMEEIKKLLRGISK